MRSEYVMATMIRGIVAASTAQSRDRGPGGARHEDRADC